MSFAFNRKKRKAEGGSSAVASKKSKQETEEEKALRVWQVPLDSYIIAKYVGVVIVFTA